MPIFVLAIYYTDMRIIHFLFSAAVVPALFSIMMLSSCGKGAQSEPDVWLGADISWATQLENEGAVFHTKDGTPMECTALMKNLGLDAVRLRVWVDPSSKGGYCDADDLLVKAKRADDLGMAVMVDFHYSDFWADPKKQNIPASWSGKPYEEIKSLLSEHTKDVLTLLKDNGITPRWVQVGNETSNGFLWTVKGDWWGDPIREEDGSITILESVGHLRNNPSQYAGLFSAGYDAVKSVFPEAEVIVHLDNGFDQGLYDRNLDTLRKYGAKWDIVGLSMYPYWALDSGLEKDEDESITHCFSNIHHIVQKYGTPCMIVETGFEVNESDPSVMEKGRDQLARIVRLSRESAGECRGVFYWEPECKPSQYKLGAFTADGYPTVIMDGFKQ